MNFRDFYKVSKVKMNIVTIYNSNARKKELMQSKA